MNKLLLLLFLATFFIVSCEQSAQQKTQLNTDELALKKELVKSVMSIHDEAMPWLDDIHQMNKAVKTKKDSLNSDSLNYELNKMSLALDSADEAMMSWMRNYREPSNDLPIDSIEGYLKDQHKKATHMRDYMKWTMEKTEQFLQQ